MDRERDRRLDFPPEDQFRDGRGQSYRPNGNGHVRERTPPARLDSYRARSPPRRSEYMDSYKADSYRGPRPRTRSPPRRDDFRRRSPSRPRYREREQPRGGDSYRARPRSPPPARREDLPRDDLFRRDVVRDDREYRDARDYRDDRDRGYMPAPAPPLGRSPPPRYRDRSAVPLKRVREPSPVTSRGRRTPPPPAKRERLASPPRPGRYDDFPPSRAASPPRRRYTPEPRDRRPSPPRGPQAREFRPRSRSPFARNDRVDPRAVDDWRRPRSPAPRHDYLREESGANSAATSRRSSPPIHPSRAALQQPPPDDGPRSRRASPRDPYDTREPYRAPDPEPKPIQTPTAARDRVYDDDRGYANARDPLPPPREPRREDDVPTPTQRAPPTGPSAQRAVSAMAPPTGPAAITPSGPRVVGAPPSGPRGGPPTPRGDFSGRGRGGYGTDFAPRGRGSFVASFRGRGGGPGPGFGRGDANVARTESFNQNQEPNFGARAPPSGPRSSFSQAPPPAFRSSSSSNTAAPFQQRPQRFENGDGIAAIPTGPKAGRRPTEPAIAPAALANRVHPALIDLPKVVEGGLKAEPLVDRTKLNKLEDEAEKLRKQIEEKETRKRKTSREWDRLARDTDAAALRSELAEQALKQLNGEGESTAAF